MDDCAVTDKSQPAEGDHLSAIDRESERKAEWTIRKNSGEHTCDGECVWEDTTDNGTAAAG